MKFYSSCSGSVPETREMAMNGAGPSNVNIKAEPVTPTQNLNVKHEVGFFKMCIFGLI